jgi:DNA-binding LacI/PurR family transcriptional regulator
MTRSDAHLARKLRFPVVNLASWIALSGVPSVTVDHEGIGRLAAQYFLKKHFLRLGYYGTHGLWFSELRRRGFEGAVRDAGRQCSTLQVQHPLDAGSDPKETVPWSGVSLLPHARR